MESRLELIPQICEGVRARDEKFGLLLISKRTPILALNEDSMMIWNCFDGESTVRDIAEKLSTQIGGELAQTTEAVGCFVDSCYDLGLIELKIE